MLQIYNYDVYIFDCDGVIFDSNKLKVNAMRNSLLELEFPVTEVDLCIDYFTGNFGKSRFHHVDEFIESFLVIDRHKKDQCRKAILKLFSLQCEKLYLSAELTPGFVEFISSLNGDKYVASGSEQQELRGVFNERGLAHYFKGIYGSPTKKADLLERILNKHSSEKAIMIGDAVSDFEASKQNQIDFVCYLPYSNVIDKMTQMSKKVGFHVFTEWPITN